MRILFVTSSMGLGGAQRQMIELTRAFRQENHHVEFLTYFEDDFFAHRLSEMGVRETCIPGKHYLGRLVRMRRFIRKGKYDAVISFLEAACFISELAGWPYRSWALIAGERLANPQILSNPKLRIYRWFHVFADYVVSNSNANLAQVKKAAPFLRDRKMHRILNIVDFDQWSPGKDVQDNEGTRVLVTAARFHGPKNLEGLISALEILDPVEREGMRIDWYGIKEGDQDRVQESNRRLREAGLEKQIRLLPAVRDVAPVLQGADAVVLFSLVEGLPNVVCEGMACARPVICSSISDLPELLGHQEALLFDPRDPHSMALSLRAFLRLDAPARAKIGERNLEVARREFDREKNSRAYLELVDHALSKRKGRK